ncbi:hypothetical protein ABW19_dt0209895 [Dactylella cylindrospora]|nr:hypothetical protein ABW19_dt0209895 [Dactylella cylindrospora]
MSGPLRQASFTLHRAALGYSHSSATLQPVRAIASPLRQQKRYAQVLDVRFVQTQHPSSVAEKYQHLLEKKAKSEGLKSVDELKQAYKGKIDNYVRESLSPPTLPGSLSHNTAFPDAIPSSPPSSTPQPLPSKPAHPKIPQSSNQKTLSSFLDISKILLHDSKEIEYIWRARHINDPNSLCAVIPLETYRRLESAAKQYPMFVLPLPRPDQGVELHFLQWQFTSPTTSNVMFTSLIEYKLHGEFASPHTTVTHHLDISPEKGVVLLQGNVVENRGVSVEEAKWLLMALQKFYGAEEGSSSGEEAGRRRELLRLFSEGKNEFDVQQLIKEVETIN